MKKGLNYITDPEFIADFDRLEQILSTLENQDDQEVIDQVIKPSISLLRKYQHLLRKDEIFLIDKFDRIISAYEANPTRENIEDLDLEFTNFLNSLESNEDESN